MDLLISVALAFVGFIIGALLFARVGRWLVSIYEVGKDPAAESKAARLAAAVFLSSGPWLLIVVVGGGYYVASEPWAVWVFVGLCAAIVFLSLLSILLARKAKSDNAKPAA